VKGVILAIDTSGSFCSIALRDAAGVVHMETSTGDGDHFERLPELVQAVCLAASCPISGIKTIAIGVGPGSFTGIRIGMSFAKGLAWSARAALVPVSSFQGCAEAASHRFSPVSRLVVVSDARRKELFHAVYEVVGSGRVVCVEEPRIVSEGHIADLLEGRDQNVQIVSPQRGLQVNGTEIVGIDDSAAGFFGNVAENTAFSIGQVAAVEPSYIRAVAAQTIAERQLKA
jgi:tRNA threonylcarbamoyl adenosine modification protein YeaZ